MGREPDHGTSPHGHGVVTSLVLVVYFLFLCAGFISMVSLIKVFVLCLFDKYLFETCESVTEFCLNPVFQMRPLTQLLSLLSGSASGQITQTNMGLVTSSAMKVQALCSMIQPSLSCWLMESEYFYNVSSLIFSHMYTTYPFSCKLMCSVSMFQTLNGLIVQYSVTEQTNNTCLLLQQHGLVKQKPYFLPYVNLVCDKF